MSGGGRYEQLLRIASGGMATVYVGRLRGAGGFSRLVAIKRAHPHLVEDPELRHVVTEEARVASNLHHPNFVAIVDVDESDGELALIMDYVEGGTVAELLGAAAHHDTTLPADAVIRIALDACAGLEAVHSLCDELGRPLRLVHRDVSPQNILVGVDGASRLSDLGVAKSLEASRGTQSGVLKGKLGYMAPEYVEGSPIDARADVYAMAIVVWEALTMTRLFRASNDAETLHRMLHYEPPPLQALRPDLPAELDGLLRAGLCKHPGGRPLSASRFAADLERIARPAGLVASHAAVAVVVKHLLGAKLDGRRNALREKMGLPVLPVGEITQDDGDAPTFVQSAGPFAVESSEGATAPRVAPRASSIPDDASDPRRHLAGSEITSSLPAPIAAADPEVTTMGRSGLVREPSHPSTVAAPPRRSPALAVGAGLAAAASAAALVFLLTRPPAALPAAPASAAPILPAVALGAPAAPEPSTREATDGASILTTAPSASAAPSGIPSANATPPGSSVRALASTPPRSPRSGPPSPPTPAKPSHFPPPPD